MQLYTKGKAINKGQVRPGCYGIPEGEEVIDLGDTIDILPLARRPKAIDMTDKDAVIVSYDPSPMSSSGFPRSRLKRNPTACTAPASSSSSAAPAVS